MGESSLDDVHVSLDPRILDIATGKRKLRSIEMDGTLTYDEGTNAEAKLTEILGRIWTEYPGGMLDITESLLESRDPDEPAVAEKTTTEAEVEEEDENGGMMSFDAMGRMRETILAQLNQSRNELWFVLEMAKTLRDSTGYTNVPPPPPSLLPQTIKPNIKPKPSVPAPENQNASVDPLVIPPGTFSTTPSLPLQKSFLTEVLELETALAAKQAALEQCGHMIDSAVDELTSMTSAGDTFWKDVRRLKEGRKGRDQWAIVPKPDFGRIADGQKAKDVIIPYAIDEASMRARSLAAFDLDPKKKELAFGARSYLRTVATVVGDDGITYESTVPTNLPDDADVGDKMEEAQMESFDEELFGEIRAEIMKRGGGKVEPRSVQFEIGGHDLTLSLVDTRTTPKRPRPQGQNTVIHADLVVHGARMSFLQMLRARKRRLTSNSSQVQAPRTQSLLAPLAQMLQHGQLSGQVGEALETLNRTLRSAGIKSSTIVRASGDSAKTLARLMDDGSLEFTGCITTLEIPNCPGIMLQTSPAIPPLINTSKASFSVADSAEVLPILADAVALQLLSAVLPVVRESAKEGKSQVYLDEMEEIINVGHLGSLRISIPAPWDAVHARLEGTDQSFDSRRQSSLFDWAKRLFPATTQ